MTVFAKKLQGAVNAYWIQPWRDHDIQQIIEYFLIYFLKKQEKQYSYVKYSEEWKSWDYKNSAVKEKNLQA